MGGTAVCYSRRFYYLCMCACCLLISDVPLCRLHYSFRLRSLVSRDKEAILRTLHPRCEEVYRNTPAGQDGECAQVCSEAYHLAGVRYTIIETCRRWHILGGPLAAFFD